MSDLTRAERIASHRQTQLQKRRVAATRAAAARRAAEVDAEASELVSPEAVIQVEKSWWFAAESGPNATEEPAVDDGRSAETLTSQPQYSSSHQVSSTDVSRASPPHEFMPEEIKLNKLKIEAKEQDTPVNRCSSTTARSLEECYQTLRQQVMQLESPAAAESPSSLPSPLPSPWRSANVSSGNSRSMEESYQALCQQFLHLESPVRGRSPSSSRSQMRSPLRSVKALHSDERASAFEDGDRPLQEKLAALREEFRTDLSNLAAELRRELCAQAGHRGLLGQRVAAEMVQLDSSLSNKVSIVRQELNTARQEIDELRACFSCFSERSIDITDREALKARWADMTSKVESQEHLCAQLNSQVHALAPKLRTMMSLIRELHQKHEVHSEALGDFTHHAKNAAASGALDKRWWILQEQLSRVSQMAKLQHDMHCQHVHAMEHLHQRHGILAKSLLDEDVGFTRAKSVLNEDEGARPTLLPQKNMLTECAEVMRAMEQSGVHAIRSWNEQDMSRHQMSDSSLQEKDGLPTAVRDELQVMRQAIDAVRAEVSPGGCWQELQERHLDLSQQVALLHDMHSHYTQKVYMDLRAVIQEVGLTGKLKDVPIPTAKAMAFFECFDTPRREQLGGIPDEVVRLRKEVDVLRDGISQSPNSTCSALNTFALSVEKELTRLQGSTEVVKGANGIPF